MITYRDASLERFRARDIVIRVRGVRLNDAHQLLYGAVLHWGFSAAHLEAINNHFFSLRFLVIELGNVVVILVLADAYFLGIPYGMIYAIVFGVNVIPRE